VSASTATSKVGATTTRAIARSSEATMPRFHSCSYRKVGWKVACSATSGKRFSGSISSAHGTSVG
jgi:hypothetical protein